MQIVNDSKSGNFDETSNVPLAEQGSRVVGGKRIARAAAARPALLLSRVGNVINEIADERLAGIGLAGRDYAVLAILATDAPDSQHELAGLMGKAPGLVVAAIDSLEDRGLVKRVRDRADRRRTRVELTHAGQKALSQSDAVAEAVLEEIFDGLDRAEREKLAELLARGVGI